MSAPGTSQCSICNARVKGLEMAHFRLAEMWSGQDLFRRPSNQSSHRNSWLFSMQLEADMKQLCCWYPLFIYDHINLSFAVLYLLQHCRCVGKRCSHVHHYFSSRQVHNFCNSILSNGIMPASNLSVPFSSI